MSRPDFQTDLDLRATRRGDAGRSYRMHRVPESDIRLWYRQKSESEPYTLYVMVIDKTGEGPALTPRGTYPRPRLPDR
jgi:hypothetical protein